MSKNFIFRECGKEEGACILIIPESDRERARIVLRMLVKQEKNWLEYDV